jgi:hypothetical protein
LGGVGITPEMNVDATQWKKAEAARASSSTKKGRTENKRKKERERNWLCFVAWPLVGTPTKQNTFVFPFPSFLLNTTKTL